VREIDLSQASSWDTDGPVGVLELSPEVEIARRSALTEVAVQPGVRPDLYADVALDPSYRAPPARLVRLARGFVDTHLWIAFNRDLGVVGSTFRNKKKLREARKHGYADSESGELALPERPAIRFDFPAVLLGGPFRGSNYFHWLFEAVGSVLLAREFMPANTRLAVRAGIEPFQVDALVLAGAARELICELPVDHLVEFPVLYLPPRAVAGGSHFVPPVVESLRTLTPRRVKRDRRLYVAREDAKVKRLVNHDEVLATLRRHGFSVVLAEGLPVREQIDLFSDAEAVVGAHGAGLANTVFCPPGAVLIELQPAGYKRARAEVYGNLAAVCGLEYVKILCRPITSETRLDITTPFNVDCAHLDEVLERRLPH
jgi:capsular polysaccharide biosynthesis protein